MGLTRQLWHLKLWPLSHCAGVRPVVSRLLHFARHDLELAPLGIGSMQSYILSDKQRPENVVDQAQDLIVCLLTVGLSAAHFCRVHSGRIYRPRSHEVGSSTHPQHSEHAAVKALLGLGCSLTMSSILERMVIRSFDDPNIS